jgi:putative oxidoreductase
MGVAVGVIHAGDPWGRKELGVLYAALYVVLFLTGPGAYSVDAWLRRRGAEAAG